MPTPTALLTQNSTQNGLTLATAFPQVTPNALGPLNQDLIHIASSTGNRVLLAVDYKGNVLGPSTLVLSQVAVSGQVVTYTGTFPNGATNAYLGRRINVLGFTTAGNNVVAAKITASTTTTITVNLTTQVNETHAASAMVYTKGVRVGRYNTNLTTAATIAQLFASAFKNLSGIDIFHAVNIGGNVHYSINSLGVASGS